MNLGAIFIGFALLVLVITFVLDPFRQRQHQMTVNADIINSGVDNSSKDALYALRDLEFDYQTDKLTEEDYRYIRTELLAHPAAAIKSRQGEDAHIEELLRNRRREKFIKSNCPQCGREFRDENKFCPECGHARTKLCQACGHQNRLENKSCTQCGQILKEQKIQS